jgi:hypothetical protein
MRRRNRQQRAFDRAHATRPFSMTEETEDDSVVTIEALALTATLSVVAPISSTTPTVALSFTSRTIPFWTYVLNPERTTWS